MQELDQELQRLVGNLSFQVMCFRVPQTPAVRVHLKNLLEHLELLVGQHRPEPEHLQISYDLLVVYASKIENEYQSQNWIVDQLLIFMDKLIYQDPMPESVKKMHSLRRGLVKNHGLTYCEQLDLVQQAYDRVKVLFFSDYIIPIDRKLKMTLGNIFSGMKNLSVLFEIHPIFTQLMLPIGPLRQQFEVFINRLVTQILTDPKLNQSISVLVCKGKTVESPGLQINFYEILNFLNIASDEKLTTSIGQTEAIYDVKLIKSVTNLIKQARPIFLGGVHPRVQSAIYGQNLLHELFVKLITAVIQLKPIYTWGDTLDEALNDLIKELKEFSSECLVILNKPVPEAPPVRSVWNLIGLWAGTGTVLNSAKNTFSKLYKGFLPKIYTLFQSFFPNAIFAKLIEKYRQPCDEIMRHGQNLISQMQIMGIYRPATQAALLAFRPKFLAMNLEPIQRILAIYHRNFEQFIHEPEKAKMIWKELKNEEKQEILMNFANLIHQVNAFMPFILCFLEPRDLRTMFLALDGEPFARESLEGMIKHIQMIQAILKKDYRSLSDSVLGVLNSSGERVSAGRMVSSSGGRVNQMVGNVVDAVSDYQINLAFNPSENGVAHLPRSWQGNNLKSIFRDELQHFFGFLEVFHQMNFEQVTRIDVTKQACIENIN